MVNPRGVVGDRDTLGDALHMLHLTGALYCRADGAAPWGVELPALPGFLTLPVVLSGEAVLEVDGEHHVLGAGSAALLSRGRVHTMRSSDGVPVVPLFDLPAEQMSERYERMRFGGEGPVTRIAYAALRADDVLTQRLVAELPDVIVVDGWDDDDAGSFAAVLRMLAREAATNRIAGETVMTRLADVLVVHVIRWWLDNQPRPTGGWLAALDDPYVGRALARMHADTAHDWTIAELAATANMSRSAFADRFAELVGTPPISYLTTWRLAQAHDELVRTGLPVATISGRAGYASEAAFSRAFKRHHAMTPGQARRSSRDDLDLASAARPATP
jgi:AraC-like DNA-binding protein